MTELRDYLETQLRDQLASTGPGVETLRHRAAARRRRRRALVGLGAASAVVATAVLAFQLSAPDRNTTPTELAVPSTAPSPDDDRRGEVALQGTFACAEQYSASAIPTRGFAFDGTVSAIDEGSQADPTSMGGDLWQVSFDVQEWFTDGEGATVTVSLFRPAPASDGRPPAFEVGTRLLVSGETQTGGADYLGWACGFTRYYDRQTAADWRAATS